MSNFVPNRMVSIKPSEPEWFSSGIKIMPKKQNRLYKGKNVLKVLKNLNRIISLISEENWLTIAQVKNHIGR